MTSKFTVRKDTMALSGNCRNFIVWDEDASEWCVARKTKRQAQDTADEWNQHERIKREAQVSAWNTSPTMQRIRGLYLIQGGAA